MPNIEIWTRNLSVLQNIPYLQSIIIWKTYGSCKLWQYQWDHSPFQWIKWLLKTKRNIRWQFQIFKFQIAIKPKKGSTALVLSTYIPFKSVYCFTNCDLHHCHVCTLFPGIIFVYWRNYAKHWTIHLIQQLWSDELARRLKGLPGMSTNQKLKQVYTYIHVLVHCLLINGVSNYPTRRCHFTLCTTKKNN